MIKKLVANLILTLEHFETLSEQNQIKVLIRFHKKFPIFNLLIEGGEKDAACIYQKISQEK